MDYSPPGSSVHGTSQIRILEWVAISSSRGSSGSRDWTPLFCTGRWSLYHWASWEAQRECGRELKLLKEHQTKCKSNSGFIDDCNKEGQQIAQTPEIQRCDCREEGENNGLKVEVRSKRNICPAYQVPWSKGVVKERATLWEGCRGISVLSNHGPCFQAQAHLCFSSWIGAW